MKTFSEVMDEIRAEFFLRSQTVPTPNKDLENLPRRVSELLDELADAHRSKVQRLERELLTVSRALAEKRPKIERVSMSDLLETRDGRAIIERAYRSDPRATETDLMCLDPGAASYLGAWWLGEQARSGSNLPLFGDP